MLSYERHVEPSSLIEEPPRKVLRLHGPVKKEKPLLTLDPGSVTSLQELNHLERNIEAVSDGTECIHLLLEKLKSSSHLMVRAKVMHLLRRVVLSCDSNIGYLADDVLRSIKETDSHQLRADMLSLCVSIVPKMHNDIKRFSPFMQLAKDGLNDTAPAVRSAALSLMGQMISISKQLAFPLEDALGMQLIIIDYTHDVDPRVRGQALEILGDLNVHGISLESSVYEEAFQALTDDYERVRMAAMTLVAALSNLTPNKLIPARTGQGQTIRMLDDGFAKVCDCINDISCIVRAQAATLMGKFLDVSQQFLNQTLDKKLMSNMRRKQSSHERQRDLYTSGEWSSGQKFADDAPKEFVDESSVSLISMGACGAYVHALEDEFMEVREAAVESMCLLAQHNPVFAIQAQDFLVDMFNDEIEEVRLRAIHSLRKIAKHLCFREDQVEIITNVLKDFNPDIRIALHRLIQESQLSTQNALRDIILALLENLRRYGEDKRTIWRAMKSLGVRHPGLVSPLLQELLSINPYFDMPEPKMEDDCYVAVMVLVYNAAACEPCIASIFPVHAVRHYQYHRNSFPQLVPAVTQLDIQYSRLSPLTNEDQLEQLSSLIMDVQQHLLKLGNIKSQETRQQLLSLCLRDLQSMDLPEGYLRAHAQYISLLIQCLQLFSKIHNHVATGEVELVVSLCKRVVTLSERMLFLFSNIPISQVHVVRQFQLISLSLSLAQQIETNSAQPEDLERYLNKLALLKRYLDKSTNHLPITERLLEAHEALKAGNWSLLISSVCTEFHVADLPLPKVNQDVTMISCELDEPQARADNPRKFTAGLAISLPVRAVLKNITSNHNLVVRIFLPDLTYITVPVKYEQLSRDDGASDEQLLNTRVVFSHQHWTEGSFVEVDLALATDSLNEFVTICPPNKVHIATRLEKKAHSGNIM